MNNYKLEITLFLRNPSSWIGIMVLLLTGMASLYFGKAFIEKQQMVIEKATVLQKKNTASNIQHFGEDIGLVFYHNKFSLANVPSPWAAFANGQRDINPYLISVTMLGLEGQLYDTDINNPMSLLMGNMDMSFVLIFLFPLVIIAFTYNLIAEQKESGVWTILKAQTNNLLVLIWHKLTVRILIVLATAFLLLLLAVFYLAIPLDVKLLLVGLVVMIYLLFWFAVSFFVVSLNKNSNYNASALVAIWVLLCVMVPAAVNLYVSRKYAMPEALAHVIQQREGYHEKWDLPKEVTMKPFIAHYPQLKQYPMPEGNAFSWFWYYGMQQMGDDQALDSRKAMEAKLKQRQSFTNWVAFFVPTVRVQLMVNEIAGSDLSNHLAFQDQVRSEHEKIRLHFYPSIFLKQKIGETDLSNSGLIKVQSLPQHHDNMGLVMLVVLSFILAAVSIGILKHRL